MIPVSANFKARRKSGVFKADHRVTLFLPVSIDGPTASSAAANFPASAVADGDRTHLNAGPLTGLYPPPAGPENFVGFGMWKASAVVPQTLILNPAGAKVGRFKIYTHPSEGGIKAFQIQTGPAAIGPWTTLTDIAMALAFEEHNGPSTVVVAAGTITVTPTNVNRPSVPSVFDVQLSANHADPFFRINITDAGPFALSAGDGFARCCEVEFYRREVLTSKTQRIEVGHSLDTTLQGITTRHASIDIDNSDLLLSVTDFQRPATGILTVDSAPEVLIEQGIDGEFISIGSFAIDTADLDHASRRITLAARAATERPLYSHTVAGWRVAPTSILADMAHMTLPLANVPQGLAQVPVNPGQLVAYAPGDTGRNELDEIRAAAADRGVFVRVDGTLGSLEVAAAMSPGQYSPTFTFGGGWLAPPMGFAPSQAADNIFFDPVDRALAIFPEQTFMDYTGKAVIGAGLFPGERHLNNSDPDRLSVWDTRKPFSTRTALVQVYAGAHSLGPAAQDNGFPVPGVMARRPATNDFYFFTDHITPNRAPFHVPPPVNALLSAYTIANGVASAPIIANQVLPGGAAPPFVTCAAFIGNIVYWWRSAAGAATLYKWDVTTPFAAVVVGVEVVNVTRMVAIGTFLYYNRAPGQIVKLDPAAYAGRAVVLTPFGGSDCCQLKVDGVILWGAADTTVVATGSGIFRWDTTTAAGTIAKPLSTRNTIPGPAIMPVDGALAIVNAVPINTYELWDGVDGSTPSVVAAADQQTDKFFTGVVTPYNALAIAATTWYEGRHPFLGWGALESGQGAAHLTWWNYRPTIVQNDDITQDIVKSVKEAASYELAGATTGVTAVDVDFNVLVTGPGAVLTLPATNVNLPVFQPLSDTIDPLSLAVVAISPTQDRRHARYPKLNLFAARALTATVITRTTTPRRVTLSDAGVENAALLNVRTINNKWTVSFVGVDTIGYRIMLEGRKSLRWLSLETVPYPELELGDVLLLKITIRANATPFTLSQRFRVVNLTHTVIGSGDSATAGTSFELVETT